MPGVESMGELLILAILTGIFWGAFVGMMENSSQLAWATGVLAGLVLIALHFAMSVPV